MVAFVILILFLSQRALSTTTISPTTSGAKCSRGMAGPHCLVPCPSTCTSCDINGEKCTGPCANQNFYGKLCEEKCPLNCDGGCYRETGVCYKCVTAYWGSFCNISCPARCRSGCGKDDMICNLCKPGYRGPFCNEKCHQNCPMCTQFNRTCLQECYDRTSFGDNCNQSCLGNCRNGCYRDTGYCFYCTEGFVGESCTKICPLNCMNGCDRYTGNCNGCRSGYRGEKCLDKCSTSCKDKCEKDTGRCDTCDSGYHGAFCELSCPSNCSEGCHQDTGECLTGEEDRGIKICPLNCRYECMNTTGKCEGCKNRYMGEYCNETCQPNCSRTCHQYTGECDIDLDTSSGSQLLLISCGVLASLLMVGITLLIVRVIRKRLQGINRNFRNVSNREDYLQTNFSDRSAGREYFAHKYWEIDVSEQDHNGAEVGRPDIPLQVIPINLPSPQPCTSYLTAKNAHGHEEHKVLERNVIFDNDIYEPVDALNVDSEVKPQPGTQDEVHSCIENINRDRSSLKTGECSQKSVNDVGDDAEDDDSVLGACGGQRQEVCIAHVIPKQESSKKVKSALTELL